MQILISTRQTGHSEAGEPSDSLRVETNLDDRIGCSRNEMKRVQSEIVLFR